MSDQESDQDISETQPDIRDGATNGLNDSLPAKSRKQYEKSYQDFMEWRMSKNMSSLSEDVLLAYFEELSTKFKSTSMWTFYSMVKSTLNIKHNVDISKYSKLITFLKQKNETDTIKKAKTFSPEEIDKFLKEAPDTLYLIAKVGLIFGIMGACRRQELYNVMFSDVQVFESTIFVTIRNTKSKTNRTFTITGNYCHVVKKYIKLRPNPCSELSFFVNIVGGKCTAQKVGINKFGGLGKTIAEFLNLPNPEMYTGHCFRRTSATILVDEEGDITALKCLRGRRSAPVAEGFINNSNKTQNNSNELLAESSHEENFYVDIPNHYESMDTLTLATNPLRINHSHSEKSDETMSDFAKDSSRPPLSSTHDEFDIYAQYVASELRETKDRNSILMAKHYINDILFNARMGKYRRPASPSTTNSKIEECVYVKSEYDGDYSD